MVLQDYDNGPWCSHIVAFGVSYRQTISAARAVGLLDICIIHVLPYSSYSNRFILLKHNMRNYVKRATRRWWGFAPQ